MSTNFSAAHTCYDSQPTVAGTDYLAACTSARKLAFLAKTPVVETLFVNHSTWMIVGVLDQSLESGFIPN